MPILKVSSPSGTRAPRSTECTTILLTPRSVLTSGWISVVICQLSLIEYFHKSWYSFAHITIQAQESSPTWTIGICCFNHSIYYLQLPSSLRPPDQSTLLYSPPRYKHGIVLAKTPLHFSSKTRSLSHSVAWEDIYRSMETLSPAVLFWESRPLWRKQHNALMKLPPH